MSDGELVEATKSTREEDEVAAIAVATNNIIQAACTPICQQQHCPP